MQQSEARKSCRKRLAFQLCRCLWSLFPSSLVFRITSYSNSINCKCFRSIYVFVRCISKRRLLLAFNSAFSNASVPFGGNHQITSDDLGRTWTAPRAIYPQLGKVVEETGPGLGLQLSPQAAKSGRILFIGSNFITEHVGHVWYSDDGGDTYTLAETDWKDTNEAQMAELPDGRVMANLRLQGFPKGRWPCACRAVATSTDSGSTWGPLSYDTHLPAPQCYATLLRLEQSLFFANPSNATQRNGGMIRRSDDWGECAQQQ